MGPLLHSMVLTHLLVGTRTVSVTMDQSSGYHHQGENHRVPSLRSGVRMLGCGQKILQWSTKVSRVCSAAETESV